MANTRQVLYSNQTERRRLRRAFISIAVLLEYIAVRRIIIVSILTTLLYFYTTSRRFTVKERLYGSRYGCFGFIGEILSGIDFLHCLGYQRMNMIQKFSNQ